MSYRISFLFFILLVSATSIFAQNFDATNAIEISQDGTNMDVEWGAPPLPATAATETPTPRVLPTKPSSHDDLAADIGDSATAEKAKKFITNYCYPDCSGCGFKSTVCQSVAYHYMQSFCAPSGAGDLLPGATPPAFTVVEQAAQKTQASDDLSTCYFMIADLLDVCEVLCPH